MQTQCRLNAEFLVAQRTLSSPIFLAKMHCANPNSQASCWSVNEARPNSSLEKRRELVRARNCAFCPKKIQQKYQTEIGAV